MKVLCFNTTPNQLNLLLDTGSDLNLIKLNVLNPNVPVEETERYSLTGITEQTILTLGKTFLPIQIANHSINAEFHVVHPNFPIKFEGILGRPFLQSNQLSVNFQNE